MQHLLVSLIVAAAAGYAAWQLMPRMLRRWLIARMMILVPSCSAWLADLAVNAENSGCRSCKGCAAGLQTAASQDRAGIDVHRRG
ncbi:hypothetical protein ACG33_09160 [Steroidobacter denitrificans]|uniref:Uncharacterized protein n=1 Tax=Steroidobacter denitrificans TaxID=465721 RepID=A0A127FC98_STEDE|nr:hypothetical protein [Steroidobacter denitrificans]AMN47260.1 hypothetical protein ACG33_09160 [Steroidobacter denitrificans]